MEERSKVNMGQKNIDFGSYLMVHIGTTNTMKISCIPEIALKASRYSVNWKELPITEETIEQVGKLAGD